MLFQVTHTHTHETCPGVAPERMTQGSAWWEAIKTAPGIKVLGGYVAPIEHTFYLTL